MAEQERELTFAEKIRTLHIGGRAPAKQTRVDDHGTHRVAVTEHRTNDRVDVTVMPPTAKVRPRG